MTDEELLNNAQFPSQEQIERAAKLAAVADGLEVNHWPNYVLTARVVLTILANTTKIDLGV
jgi:hypothetical protein